MTLTLTPKQLATLIATAARATLAQCPTESELEHACKAIGANAVQAALAFQVDEE